MVPSSSGISFLGLLEQNTFRQLYEEGRDRKLFVGELTQDPKGL